MKKVNKTRFAKRALEDFSRTMIELLSKKPFENIMVKIPAQYDEILKRSYGDYMKLPPKEERVATHEYTLYKR